MKRPLCVLAGLLAATLLAGAASAADLISLRLGDVKGDRYAALRASGEPRRPAVQAGNVGVPPVHRCSRRSTPGPWT